MYGFTFGTRCWPGVRSLQTMYKNNKDMLQRQVAEEPAEFLADVVQMGNDKASVRSRVERNFQEREDPKNFRPFLILPGIPGTW